MGAEDREKRKRRREIENKDNQKVKKPTKQEEIWCGCGEEV